MAIHGRTLEHALRAAEQQELIDGEGSLMSDLYGIVTPEAVKDGLYISFEGDRKALEATLSALGINESLGRSTHIHNVLTVTNGATSYLGRSIPVLSELPLVDALDALQADRWAAYKRHGLYRTVGVAHEEVTTQIVIANTAPNDRREPIADTTMPGLVVGSTYRYLPGFGMEYEDEFSLRLAELLLETTHQEERVARVAEAMACFGTTLRMPCATYFLQLGEFERNMLGGLSGVTVSDGRRYVVEGGRFRTIDEDQA